MRFVERLGRSVGYEACGDCGGPPDECYAVVDEGPVFLCSACARVEDRRVDSAEIEAAKTSRGGWTKAQLAKWGVPWPPPRGWRKKLEGETDAAAS